MRLQELDTHRLAIVPLIGSPVSATFAPNVYNRLFDEYGINAVSRPIEIHPAQLPEFLQAVRLLGIPGFVLTAPLKSAIVPLLDDVDDVSRLFNSVNVVRLVDGRFRGSGLDGVGVIGSFDSRGVELSGKRVMMIGAGGVAGILAAAFAERGASQLTIVNRTLPKAEAIGVALRSFCDMDVTTEELTVENLNRLGPEVDVVLQATTLGMKSSDRDWTDLEFLAHVRTDAWVMEAVSNPVRTSFVRAAEEHGLNVILGVDMMVEQLGAIFSYLLDIDVPREGKAIAREFFRERVG